ncbi:MAG: hypothetical protein WCE61_12685 [Candidatus Acidiferrum sp.]
MKLASNPVKFLMFLFALSLGAVLFSTGLSAQDGGWRISRADYGFRSQRTDVTRILRVLISRGGVNGRVAVNNQTMGGDPAVGKDKTLRIFARNDRNEEREFDYREGGFIDVIMFAVPEDHRNDSDRERDGRDRGDRDRGGFGPRGLEILYGFYGVQGRTANVTDRLQSMVRDGVLELNVNNYNLGGDPAIGANKVLIVVYRDHGREQATAVPEGNRLRIP